MESHRRSRRIRPATLFLLILLAGGLGVRAYTLARQERRGRALMLAVVAGNTIAVKNLLDSGADANTRQPPTRDPPNWLELLPPLLGLRTDRQPTALIRATQFSHLAVAKLLLEHGADVNAKEQGRAAALMYAAYNGDIPMAGLLLDRGADVNARDKDGVSALTRTTVEGHADMVALLLSRGAEVDARDNDGATALQMAARSGQTDMVQLLMAKGADIQAQDKDGYTALKWAIEHQHHRIVQILIQAGAKE